MLEDYSTDQSKSYKIQTECAQWFDSFAKLLKHSYELGYLILFFISPLLPPPTLSFIYMMSYNIKDQHLMGEDNVKKIVYLVLFLYLFFVLFTMILKVI